MMKSSIGVNGGFDWSLRGRWPIGLATLNIAPRHKSPPLGAVSRLGAGAWGHGGVVPVQLLASVAEQHEILSHSKTCGHGLALGPKSMVSGPDPQLFTSVLSAESTV